MMVHYEPDSMGGYVGCFEFRSPYNPPKRIPMSKTGYYVSMETLNTITDMEAYIRKLAKAIINHEAKHTGTYEKDDKQIALF